MAKDLVFEIDLDSNGKGAKSLKSLREDFKNLQKELATTEVGTEKYHQTLQRLGAVRDEIGDLNQTINALNPEGKVQAFANVAGKLAGGFQAATGAAALFGIQSEELEKQLLRVQAATALAQGIQSVVGLTDAFQVLGAVIKANPIMTLVSVITGVTAAIAAYVTVNDEAARSTKALTDEIAAEKEATDELNKSIDRRAALMKAQGASELEILRIRKEGLIELYNNQKEITERAAELFLNSEKENSAEREKIFNKETQKLIEIKTNGRIVTAQIDALTVADAQKASEDRIKANENAANEAAMINSEFYKNEAQAKQNQEDVLFGIEAMTWDELILPKKIENSTKDVDIIRKSEAEKREEKKRTDDFIKLTDDELLKRKQEQKQRELQENHAYFSAIQSLSTFYFNSEMAAAKGNAKEQERLRKEQFKADKALRAVQAAMNTAEAVTANLEFPPLALAIGIAGAAQVAAILSQQYNGGGSVASPGTASPGIAPQIQTTAPNIGVQTRLNEQGQNLSNIKLRSYVVETDITSSQERVKRLESQSTF